MSRGYLEVQRSLITHWSLMLSFAPPHMASPIIPQKPALYTPTHPCTLQGQGTVVTDTHRSSLSPSTGCKWLLVLGTMQDPGCGFLQPVREQRMEGRCWVPPLVYLAIGLGPQHQPPLHYRICFLAWRHDPRRGQVYQSKLAGIIALKITLNMLLKDRRAWEMSAPVPCSEIC